LIRRPMHLSGPSSATLTPPRARDCAGRSESAVNWQQADGN
jgi:hypothetical protein